MPKTQDGVPQACAKVEIRPGCVGSWIDISGESNIADLPGEEVERGSVPVFGDDTHVLGTGKKNPVEPVITIVYTEETDEAMEYVWDTWITPGCNKLFCTRITPKGGSVGNLEWYIGEDLAHPAYLIVVDPPTFDAGDGAPATGSFTVYGNYTRNTKTS